MVKKRYLLTISYDGTHFSGWQVQKKTISIQQMIEDVLTKLLQENITIMGSGRTDSGVHALEQKAHFDTERELAPSIIKKSLNSLLPKDIRILSLENVEKDFHARFSCKKKIYRYHIHRNDLINPFNKLYRYHFPYPLDLHLMTQAAKLIEGTHDFTSFANKAHMGSAKNNPVKTIHAISILQEGDDLIFEFVGNGFLYKMVRNLSSLLIEVGQKKISLDNVLEIMDAKDRKKAPKALPSSGLFLTKVMY